MAPSDTADARRPDHPPVPAALADADDIDQRFLKFLVGGIALALAPVAWALTRLVLPDIELTSISASYWFGGFPQAFFIGSLFAIASFLYAYGGADRTEWVLSKTGATASLLIAVFPCLDRPDTKLAELFGDQASRIHAPAATVMFFVLAMFCRSFWRRADEKVRAGNQMASWRSWIYFACFFVIVGAMCVMGWSTIRGEAAEKDLIFLGEAAGLTAFGIAWLTASKVLFAERGERLRVLPGGPGA